MFLKKHRTITHDTLPKNPRIHTKIRWGEGAAATAEGGGVEMGEKTHKQHPRTRHGRELTNQLTDRRKGTASKHLGEVKARSEHEQALEICRNAYSGCLVRGSHKSCYRSLTTITDFCSCASSPQHGIHPIRAVRRAYRPLCLTSHPPLPSSNC